MPEPLFSPIRLHFAGLDADQHHLDAEQFGKSVIGTAKLYNAATHLFYTGSIPGGRTIYKIRMHTTAELEKGSVCYSIWAALELGQMAVYPQLWGEIADMFIPDWVKAVYAKLVHRDNDVIEIYQKHMQIMQEERQKEREHTERITQMAFTTLLESQSNFTRTIENIADNSRGAARDSVEPIGYSAARIEQHSQTRIVLQLDQPVADALRSKEELQVTDSTTYFGKIVEADKTKKSCRVMLDGQEKPISARINDPVIENTGNIYTHALDQDLRVKIEAKATVKNDEIKMLYISNAQEDTSS